MLGKLFKTALTVIKLPFSVIDDVGNTLLHGENDGEIADNLEELGEDIEDLFDPFDPFDV